MEKRVIYEKFNTLTGKWERGTTTKSRWLKSISEFANEKEIIDAELEVINKIIEQHLNNPVDGIKLVESKD